MNHQNGLIFRPDFQSKPCVTSMENRILFDIWGNKNHPGFFNPASVHTEAARFVIGSVPLHAIGLAFGDGLTNGFQLPKILALISRVLFSSA